MGYAEVTRMANAAGTLINPAIDTAPTLSGTLTRTATGVIFGPVDASYLRYVSLRTSGTFVATLQWEVSHDGGTTWDNFVLQQADSTGPGHATSTTSANVILHGAIPGPLFRLNVSAYTSGTVTVQVWMSQTPLAPHAVTISTLSPGTSASNLGKAEDAAHTSGDVGIAGLLVRDDNPVGAADRTSAAGDYINPTADSKGRAWGRVFVVEDDGTIINPATLEAQREGYDIFGRQKVSTDYNQVEVPYDQANWTDFVDVTQSGGPTGPSQANGQVTIASGTGTNASYVVLSKDATKYRMGHEVGWGGTWFFDATGLANADIWWGAADDASLTNAVLFGWFNNVFGIRYRRGGSTIQTWAQASWLDKCDGTAGSAYTSGGVPVALDKTKCQLARIRAGLWGYRGFIVEIAAPDPLPNGAVKWVKVIDNSLINTGTTAAFTNNNLKVGMGFTKTAAGATSVSVTASCQAGWTATDKARVSDTLTDRTLATPVIATLQGRTNAGAWVAVNVNNQGRLFVTNDSVGATGATAPTQATLIGVKDQAGNLQVYYLGSEPIAGLSFVQTVATTYTTAWVDISRYLVLNFGVELQDAETGTGTVEFTNAADPNTTPPGSSDMTRTLDAVLAGNSLGGLSKSGFDVPCGGWRWARVKFAVGATGTQDVKVTCRGQSFPASMGILPIAAAITKDYGAALVRGVTMGVDANGTPQNVSVDANKNLFTRNTPNPYSAGPGRTPKDGFLDNQTADALLYTVTAGKTLYVTTLVIGVVNTATSAGRILLRDGTTAAGTGKIPFLTPPAGTGLLQSAVGPATFSVPLPEPMKFTSGIFVDVLAGTLTYSIMFIGYEE